MIMILLAVLVPSKLRLEEVLSLDEEEIKNVLSGTGGRLLWKFASHQGRRGMRGLL